MRAFGSAFQSVDAGEILGDREAPAPGFGADGRRLLGGREDVLLTLGQRRERHVGAHRGLPALLGVALGGVHAQRPQVEADAGQRTADPEHEERCPLELARLAKLGVFLPQALELPGIDDDRVFPVCHGFTSDEELTLPRYKRHAGRPRSPESQAEIASPQAPVTGEGEGARNRFVAHGSRAAHPRDPDRAGAESGAVGLA
jgi:hypothetical protein